ncbi:hypothetical protein GUJ93_ZPchr0015g6890, partial [Zizania palustris]
MSVARHDHGCGLSLVVVVEVGCHSSSSLLVAGIAEVGCTSLSSLVAAITEVGCRSLSLRLSPSRRQSLSPLVTAYLHRPTLVARPIVTVHRPLVLVLVANRCHAFRCRGSSVHTSSLPSRRCTARREGLFALPSSIAEATFPTPVVVVAEGWDCLDTTNAAELLTLSLQTMGKLKESEELLERCLEVRKKILSKDHFQ